MLAHSQHNLGAPACLSFQLANDTHFAPQEPASYRVVRAFMQTLNHLPYCVMLVQDDCSFPIRRNETHHIELIDMQYINMFFLQQLTNHSPHSCAFVTPE